MALLETKFDALFLLNWVVNLIFICDMVINFVLPYKESAKQGGGTVKDHKKIAKRYLTSWFPIDLISILPFDSVEVFAKLTTGNSPFGDNADTLKIIKMIRLLRLLKLARILRASRIFSRWENELGMSYQKMELIKWTVLVFVRRVQLARPCLPAVDSARTPLPPHRPLYSRLPGAQCVMHLLACVWCLIATLQGSLRGGVQKNLERWVADCMEGENCLAGEAFNGVCTGCIKDNGSPWRTDQTQIICDSNPCLTECELAIMEATWRPHGDLMPRDWIMANENWMCRYSSIVYPQTNDDPSIRVGAVYAAALYVAMLQVGGGVGSIVPTNPMEYVCVTFCLLAGSTIWALIVGTICGIVATGDPHMTEFKQKMDELNYFMFDMNISQTMRVRAREYFRNTRDLRKKLSYVDLVHRLSPTLRGEVVLQMSKKTLETVWYLRSCEPAFLVELAVLMQREGYAPREKIPSLKLCIVMRGVAAKGGNILTVGDHWGEDMIVSSVALRDTRHASALTYVEVGTIAREDLEELLMQFRQSERAIRQAAMKIAMQRAIVVISEFVRMQQVKASGGFSLATGLGKLAGAINSVQTLNRVSDATHLNDPNSNASDPSVILTMITGGKMKEINEDGSVIEDDDDVLQRRMSTRSDESEAQIGAHLETFSAASVENQKIQIQNQSELLKELRESRKEMKQAMADSRAEMAQAMAEMRREVEDLKSQVTFSAA